MFGRDKNDVIETLPMIPLRDVVVFPHMMIPFVIGRQSSIRALDHALALAALKAESERRGWTHQEEIYRPTPRIPLHGSFEEYLARIDKKQRHEIRRKMRRAAESEKNVRLHVIDRSVDIEFEINAIFDLMVQDPHKEKFLHPDMREQMTITIRNAFERGYLWLGFLEVEGAKAAASLNFDYKNKLWGYNSGVGREHMELSPGWVLLAHVILWCTENGRYEFDFMRGDEDYKYRFGGENCEFRQIRVAQRSIGRLVPQRQGGRKNDFNPSKRPSSGSSMPATTSRVAASMEPIPTTGSKSSPWPPSSAGPMPLQPCQPAACGTCCASRRISAAARSSRCPRWERTALPQ